MSQSSGHAPLVWFTSLAIGGAGMIAAAALRLPSFGLATEVEALRVNAPFASPAVALATGSVALGAGILVSLLHLGRKSRAPLAARGVGRSAISREILLAGAALAAALALLLANGQDDPRAWARLAAATAALFLLSIGLVYRIAGQRTWRGATVLLPLTTGLVCGEMFLLAIASASVGEAGLAFWASLFPIDAMVFACRWRTLVRVLSRTTPPRVAAKRIHNLSAARLLIVDVMPLVLVAMNAPGLAFVAVASGLAFDRWLFYALADQHTTEGEIGRVEAIIERAS